MQQPLNDLPIFRTSLLLREPDIFVYYILNVQNVNVQRILAHPYWCASYIYFIYVWYSTAIPLGLAPGSQYLSAVFFWWSLDNFQSIIRWDNLRLAFISTNDILKQYWIFINWYKKLNTKIHLTNRVLTYLSKEYYIINSNKLCNHIIFVHQATVRK